MFEAAEATALDLADRPVKSQRAKLVLKVVKLVCDVLYRGFFIAGVD